MVKVHMENICEAWVKLWVNRKPEIGKGIKPKLASSISRRLGYAGQAASGPPSPT